MIGILLYLMGIWIRVHQKTDSILLDPAVYLDVREARPEQVFLSSVPICCDSS